MQELTVVERLYPAILHGEKLHTIRWRELRIEAGRYLRYVCAADPQRQAIVWVTRCTDLPLSQAAALVGMEKEWPKPVMLEGMREHYPRIGWEDIVQVVEHLSPAASARRADFPR